MAKEKAKHYIVIKRYSHTIKPFIDVIEEEKVIQALKDEDTKVYEYDAEKLVSGLHEVKEFLIS